MGTGERGAPTGELTSTAGDEQITRRVERLTDDDSSYNPSIGNVASSRSPLEQIRAIQRRLREF